MTIKTNVLRVRNDIDFVGAIRRLFPNLDVESFVEEYYLDDDANREMHREVYRLHGEVSEGFIAFMKKWEFVTTPMVWEISYHGKYVENRIL